jgi:hypothetical protein
MRSLRASLVVVSACSAGCFPTGPNFEGPARLRGLRAVAITSAPGSGSPGGSVELELQLFDGRAHPGAPEYWGPVDGGAGLVAMSDERPISIAWLGGCHNPPGDSHFGCYPMLNEIARRLPSPLPTTPAAVPAEAAGFLGLGRHFTATIPPDILEGRQREDSAPPFGVSFAFFAACKGQLVPAPDANDGVPLACQSEAGEPITDAKAFLRGFTTFYTYAGGVNRAPVVSRRLTAGIELMDVACETDADCAELASGPFGSVCASPWTPLLATAPESTVPEPKRCLPSVPRCRGPECEDYELLAELSPESVEKDTAVTLVESAAPDEVIWVKYYAIFGLSRTEALINERATGFNEDYATRWRPPPVRTETPFPVWAVIQDNRGASTVVRWDFVVTD